MTRTIPLPTRIALTGKPLPELAGDSLMGGAQGESSENAAIHLKRLSVHPVERAMPNRSTAALSPVLLTLCAWGQLYVER